MLQLGVGRLGLGLPRGVSGLLPANALISRIDGTPLISRISGEVLVSRIAAK